MKTRTLVGRLAAVQLSTLAVALAAVLLAAFVAVSGLLERERDRSLRGLADSAATVIADELDDHRGPAWLAEELAEHRAEGVRLEALDAAGDSAAQVGDGPGLRLVPSGACADQGPWRVCAQTAGPYRIVAGRSIASDRATVHELFSTFALVALAVLAISGLLGRRLARQTLRPLSEMGARIGAMRPGEGERVGAGTGLRELAVLAAHFDGLLERVDDMLARERRFSAEASHELRTPLTVLRGEVESIFLAGGAAAPAAHRALAAIDELIGIVEALLMLSRTQAPLDRAYLELVNLADIARDQAHAVARRRHAPRSVRVDAPDEAIVAADERLVGRAIANLLENAIKHSGSDRPVELSIEARPGWAVLAVRDHGAGIPPQVWERIFEPFFRAGEARAAVAGHGLGLPLARAVARALGGDVRVAPAAGDGARLELTLPSPPASNV